MKCNQSRPGFELVSPCPFPTTITITPRHLSRDCFNQFDLLIINYIQLIPPNTEQNLRTVDIPLCRWCWCINELIPRSSILKIIVVYSLFITSHDTMQKKLSFFAFDAAVLMFPSRTAPNFLAFESFLMFSNVLKLLCDQLRLILLTPNMSLHEIMPPVLRLQTFSVRQSVLYLQHQNHYFSSIWTNFCMLFPTKNGHRKF